MHIFYNQTQRPKSSLTLKSVSHLPSFVLLQHGLLNSWIFCSICSVDPSISTLFLPEFIVDLEEGTSARAAEILIMSNTQQKKRRKEMQKNTTKITIIMPSNCSISSGCDSAESSLLLVLSKPLVKYNSLYKALEVNTD